MQAIKKLLLILTLGNIGLHHILNNQWKKSLPLLISFIILIFALMGNVILIRNLKQLDQNMPMPEMLLLPGSFFTWIFLLSFVMNRLLWAWEVFNWLRVDLFKSL